MKFDVLTIFPQIFSAKDGYLNQSIIKRAQEKKLVQVKAHDIRKFSKDRHKKVDDRPFGGGAGMVLLFEPIARAVQKVRIRNQESRIKNGAKAKKTRTILFSTRGKKFTNKEAKRLAKYDQLVLICGRYEGVDERVVKTVADEEISIGDYVLTGGELAAMVVIDSVSRQIPGVLGKKESLEEEQGSYPTYTRPEIIELKVKSKKGKEEKTKGKKLIVPKVLLSGNHKEISKWREKFGNK